MTQDNWEIRYAYRGQSGVDFMRGDQKSVEARARYLAENGKEAV